MRPVFFFAAAALAALPALAATAQQPLDAALVNGSEYIFDQQQPDGGYGSSGLGQDTDAVFAVRAAGYDPAKDARAGKSAVDYLKAHAAEADKPAAAAKAALAAKAAGLDPKNTGGTNFVAVITGGLDAGTKRYASDDFSDSLAILGLACTGNAVPGDALSALKATQLADGGWGFAGASDADTTAIALQALLAAGAPKSDAAATKAVAYLKASQAGDGGWGFDPTASNTSSTAFAVQALLAAGENPQSAAYTKAGVTPIAFLLSQQAQDGSFAGFDPLFATNQVLPALAGRTFCNAAETPITRTRLTTQAPSPTATATTTTTATATETAVATATATPVPATAAPVATAPGTVTATPARTATSAPGAPSTGTGTAAGHRVAPWLFVALALAAGGAAVALAKRR